MVLWRARRVVRLVLRSFMVIWRLLCVFGLSRASFGLMLLILMLFLGVAIIV